MGQVTHASWGGRQQPVAPAARGERGMVTAELALGLMVAALVAVVALWAVGVGGQQLALADVATQVARQEARGDAAAVAQIQRRVPDAQIDVSRCDGLARVRVTLRTRPFGALPAVELTARATSLLEPGEQP